MAVRAQILSGRLVLLDHQDSMSAAAAVSGTSTVPNLDPAGRDCPQLKVPESWALWEAQSRLQVVDSGCGLITICACAQSFCHRMQVQLALSTRRL